MQAAEGETAIRDRTRIRKAEIKLQILFG